MRTFHQLLLITLLAIAAAGCDARLEVDLDLGADGSGILQVTAAVDAELQGQAAAVGADPLGRAVQRIREGGSAWSADVSDTPEGGRMATIRVDIDEPADVARRIDELRGALDTDEAALLGPLSVTVDDEAKTILVEGEVVVELGEALALDAGVSVDELNAQLQDVVSTTLTVTTPGPLLESAPGAQVIPVTPDDPSSPVVIRWRASPGQRVPAAALIRQPARELLGILLQAGVALLALLAIAGGVWAQRARRRL